ncbi:MAG: hypothetical protein IAI49_13220 [Candidatus Eremiobacteraeota bacterium]|nr:hypothetical protein [Candidatus Eremiobacteraeota bacterium]
MPLEPDAATLSMLLDVLRAQGDRAFVVVARRAHLHPGQQRAIEALLEVAPHAIVISALEPFDVPALESAAVLLCSFGDEQANVEALADVLVGSAPATGAFPVALSTGTGRRLLTDAEIDAKLPRSIASRVVVRDEAGDDAEAGGA